jgi:hypothetical protein
MAKLPLTSESRKTSTLSAQATVNQNCISFITVMEENETTGSHQKGLRGQGTREYYLCQ